MSRTLPQSPTNARSPSAEPSAETLAAPEPSDRRHRSPRSARRIAWFLCAVLVASLFVVGVSPVGAVPIDDVTTGGAPEADSDPDSLAVGGVGTAPAEVNASFSREIYATTAGDPVEFTVLVEEETYLLVGGNRLSDSGASVGFTDVIRLEPGEGSRMDVTLNTRVAGTGTEYVSASGNGTATSCSIGGCDLTFTDENGGDVGGLSDLSTATGAGGLTRPLAAERYQLAAVENATFTVTGKGVVSPAAPAARSNVLVVEPERHLGEEIDLFTTMPAGSNGSIDSVNALRSEGLERSAVTKGDRLVIGVEAAGIWGAMSHVANDGGGPITAGENASGEVLRDLLAKEEGIDLRIEHTNPGQNRQPTRIDSSVLQDATLLFESPDEFEAPSADPSAGRLYLVIDTSDDNAIGERLDPGEEYRVTFELAGERGERYRFAEEADGPFDAASVEDGSVPEQFPYFSSDEAGVSVETTFSIQERYIEYDHHTDEGEIFVADGEITGTTTLLPATELTAEFTYDGGDRPQLSESTVSIDDGGNFSVDLGLSGVPPGDRVLFELRDDSGLRDSRTVIAATDAADPHRLRLTNTTTNVTVTRKEPLSALSTTVRNVGVVEDRKRLSLDVADGAIVEERYVTVGPDAPRNETFGGVDADLEPGNYSYTLSIDEDRVNGTVMVEADPAVTRIDSDGNGTSVDGGPDGNGSNPDSNSDGGDQTTGNGSDPTDNSTDSQTNDGTNNGTEPPETNGTDGGDSARDTASVNATGGDGPSEAPPTDAPTTFLPFGIGTRETLVGTLLVGAVHLLGHWV
jgi:hypothetical protein